MQRQITRKGQSFGLTVCTLLLAAIPISLAVSPAQAQPTDEQKKIPLPKLCDNLQTQFKLEGHLFPVTAMAVSADSKTLVSGDRSGVVHVWSLETGKLLYQLAAYPGMVKTVAISPDGNSIVSASFEDWLQTKKEVEIITVKIWDLRTGQLIQSQQIWKNIPPRLSSVDSSSEAVRNEPTEIARLNSQDAQTLIRISVKDERLFSEEVKIEFLNQDTGTVIPSDSPIVLVDGFRKDSPLIQSSDQTLAASATFEGLNEFISFITLQDLISHKPICAVPKPGEVRPIVFSPDRQKLIIASRIIEVMALHPLAVNSEQSEQQSRIQHLNQLGFDKFKRKQYYSAARHFWQAFEIARQLGDEQGQVDALYNLAGAYYAQCQVGFNSCQIYYQRLYELVLPYFQASGDRTRATIALHRKNANFGMGVLRASKEDYQAALKQAQRLGDHKAEADTLVKIAWLSALDYDETDDQTKNVPNLLTQALKLYRAIGSQHGELEASYALGLFYSELPPAISYLQSALKLSRQIGDRLLESSILLDLGDVYRWGRQYPEALASYQSSLTLRRSLGDDTIDAILLYRIGQTHYQMGQYGLALAAYQKTLTICQVEGENCLGNGREYLFYERDASLVLQGIGESYLALKQYSEALGFFQQGGGSRDWEINKNIGLTYEKLGNTELALEYFGRILHDRGPGCGGGEVADATIIESFRIEISGSNDRTECQGNRQTWIPALGIATFHSAEIYRRRGQYDKAIAIYTRSIERTGNDESILNNLGTLYKALGDYTKALETYHKALWLHRNHKDRQRDPYGEAVSLNNIGEVYRRLGQYSKALETYQQSIKIFRDLASAITATQATITPVLEVSTLRQGEAAVLHNFGGVYYDLGQYDKAIDFYNRALAISLSFNDKAGQGRSLNNMGLVYEAQRQYAKALETYQQALVARRAADDRPGAAATLNNIGLVQTKLGQTTQGIEPLQQSLAIFQALEDKASQANTHDSLGTLYTALGQYPQALYHYQTALQTVKTLNLPPLEGVIYSNLGHLLAKMNQPELAIALYKQSVSIRETLRQGIQQLPRESQDAYTQSVAGTYRSLADLLLQQDRIQEAQQILELLKIQELTDALQTSRGQRQLISFRQAEVEFLQAFAAQRQGAVAAAQELQKLLDKPEAQRTSADRDRIHQLNQLEDSLANDFQQFINRPEVQTLISKLRRQDSGILDPQLLEDLQNRISNQLAKLPNTALLYPLILDDRLELILITANSQPLRRTVKIDRPTLNKAIAEFSQAIQNPRQDPLPSAQKLYDILMRPIDADLEKADIKTLLYSPDRRLRYVPLPALHDGKQWLTQRLQINYITAASTTDLTTPRQAQPKVLAAAISSNPKQHYVVELPTLRREFTGLPNVVPEVTAIANSLPNTRKLLEGAFTLDTIRELASQYNILHFATHGSFEREQPELSFILFGDKNRDGKNFATLRDIGTWRLNADLVVLSACETGRADDQFNSQSDNNVAVMGLGYQFEQAGARATIASLWQVNDTSTSLLMQQFYKNLAIHKLSKAAALQQAQRAFLQQTITAKDAPTRAELTVTGNRATEQAQNFAHPYYWAPFILIGNGL